jgi:hypothetical protein
MNVLVPYLLFATLPFEQASRMIYCLLARQDARRDVRSVAVARTQSICFIITTT